MIHTHIFPDKLTDFGRPFAIFIYIHRHFKFNSRLGFRFVENDINSVLLLLLVTLLLSTHPNLLGCFFDRQH